MPSGTSPREVKLTALIMTISMFLTPIRIMYDYFHTMTEALSGSNRHAVFCKTRSTYNEALSDKSCKQFFNKTGGLNSLCLCDLGIPKHGN